MPATGVSAPPTDTPSTDWQPLRLLTFYRAVMAGTLATLYLALGDSNPFNVQLAGLFKSTLFAYLLFSVAAGFGTRLQWPGYRFQALLQVLADIGAIALLMHASGGVASSLTILLVVAVVVGALVLPGRTAYLFAAVATLAILFETGLTSLTLEQASAGHITRAGLLGAVLFVAAGLAHILAIRARESAALAEQRGIDLANLEQLNRYIVQQLESGLLVVDADLNVRLANDNARALLATGGALPPKLDSLPAALTEQFRRWKNDHYWQPQPVEAPGLNTTLMPRFSELSTPSGKGALILLDDSARLAQQAQQLKLAALGRLTASIAHEIRNPLGAISHAAQLLGESEVVSGEDRRLTEIIANHTRRMNDIIENVLQLSRRSVSQPQTLRLEEWLPGFREDFCLSQNIPGDRLRLEIQADSAAVQADPGHLHQVLSNLCDNALQHADSEHSSVRLRVQQSATGPVQLDVIDTGPGIDAETAEQMFEPFYTTAATGTGLGLYIARELCEINQARLTYQAPGDAEACFRIRFS